jgi:NADPH:quinone reductase-like Zn-dependent oxidoreductase
LGIQSRRLRTPFLTEKVGDEVFAATWPLESTGSHAQFVCVSEHHASIKPKTLSHKEACSLAYTGKSLLQISHATGVTALGAMKKAEICQRQRVLVVGAAGGIGSFITTLV